MIQAVNVEKAAKTLPKGSGKKLLTSKEKEADKIEECPLLVAFLTFLSYGVLLLVGYIKEFFFPPSNQEKNREVCTNLIFLKPYFYQCLFYSSSKLTYCYITVLNLCKN